VAVMGTCKYAIPGVSYNQGLGWRLIRVPPERAVSSSPDKPAPTEGHDQG